MFSLAKRRLREDVITLFNYVKGKRTVINYSPCPPRVGQQAMGFVCSNGDLGWISGKTLGIARHWNRLPSQAVESPSLNVFESRGDKLLSGMV